MRWIAVVAIVAWSGLALADDEMPPLEAALRAGYEDASHKSVGAYERVTDAGPTIDGELGILVAPHVAVLAFASYAWLPDAVMNDQHEMGYSYKDSHVHVTDFGVRAHYRGDAVYIGGGLGYESARFATVYTDLMSGVYDSAQYDTRSSLYVEAHVGFRGPRLDECRCSIDVLASLVYSSTWIKANSWTDSAVIVPRISAGLAFW